MRTRKAATAEVIAPAPPVRMRIVKNDALEPVKVMGRPKKDDAERADYRLNVRLKNVAGEALDAFAEAHGVSVSQAVIDALIRCKMIPR